MSERIEALRQRAREEAADRARQLATARKTTGNSIPATRPPATRVRPPVPGETTCPRCGARSSVGCRHNPLSPITRPGSLA